MFRPVRPLTMAAVALSATLPLAASAQSFANAVPHTPVLVSCKVIFIKEPTVIAQHTVVTEQIPSNVDAANNVFFLALGRNGSCSAVPPPSYITIPGVVKPRTRLVTFESGYGPIRLDAGTSYVLYSYAVPAKPAPFVYVVDHGNSNVSVFSASASGNTAPVRQITNVGGKGGAPRGIAQDRLGNIYVTTIAADGRTTSVQVFAPGAAGNARPMRTIVGPKTTLTNAASDTGVGPDGAVYVNIGSGVAKFAPNANGNVAPVALITGLNGGGAAVTTANQLYTSTSFKNSSVLDIFPPNATGPAKPLATIGGPRTGVSTSLVAADPFDNVYQTSSGVAVVEFSPYQFGNVFPMRLLFGPQTTLTGVQPIAVDGAANLFVADEGNGRLLRFAPSADGNAAPLAIITGSKTGLIAPAAIVAGP